MSGCGQIQIDKLLEESAARADELAGRSSKVSSKRRDAWSPWLASIAGLNECAPQRCVSHDFGVLWLRVASWHNDAPGRDAAATAAAKRIGAAGKI